MYNDLHINFILLKIIVLIHKLIYKAKISLYIYILREFSFLFITKKFVAGPYNLIL
jgi:hypothetical protein